MHPYKCPKNSVNSRLAREACSAETETGMIQKFGLKEATIQKICGVFARHPQVEEAVLYGSRAKGNYKHGSDIALTLRGQSLTWDILYKLLQEIDDLMMPYTVDLSILDHIRDPDLVKHIERVGVTFYAKTPVELSTVPA